MPTSAIRFVIFLCTFTVVADYLFFICDVLLSSISTNILTWYSGEGVPDLLLLLVLWTQKTMVEKLTFRDEVQVCFISFILCF